MYSYPLGFRRVKEVEEDLEFMNSTKRRRGSPSEILLYLPLLGRLRDILCTGLRDASNSGKACTQKWKAPPRFLHSRRVQQRV